MERVGLKSKDRVGTVTADGSLVRRVICPVREGVRTLPFRDKKTAPFPGPPSFADQSLCLPCFFPFFL